MYRPRSKWWQKASAVLVLALTMVIVARSDYPERLLPEPAYRFVYYYRALGERDVPVSAWQRLLFSLMLANSKEPHARSGRHIKDSSPSS